MLPDQTEPRLHQENYSTAWSVFITYITWEVQLVHMPHSLSDTGSIIMHGGWLAELAPDPETNYFID